LPFPRTDTVNVMTDVVPFASRPPQVIVLPTALAPTFEVQVSPFVAATVWKRTLWAATKLGFGTLLNVPQFAVPLHGSVSSRSTWRALPVLLPTVIVYV
jgi:hypothetical protein